MGRDDPELERAVDLMKRFLGEALASGEIDPATYERLSIRLSAFQARQESRTPARAAVPGAIGPPPPMPAMPVMPAIPPMPPYRAAPPPVRRRPAQAPAAAPSPIHAQIDRIREAIASDLGVHGLAYLGVLLVFAGAMGFFLFSFGTMSHAIRPFAELAIPVVLFGSAWYLRRRGAPVVATALGLTAGVLLPVVLFASFVDGVAFPPDPQGNALAVAVTVTSLVLAAAYAAVASRWPDVSVRFLVAPMVWVALWGIGLALAPGPTVRLNEWDPWSFAMAAVGVTGTAAVVRVRPGWRAARDAMPSVIPGALLTLGLTLLLARSVGWPWGPSVVACLASLATSELVAPRLPTTFVQVAQPVLLWMAVAALDRGEGDVVAGVAGATGSLALLEWQSWRRPGEIPILAGVLGLVAGIALTRSDPWAMAATAGATAVWGHARRIWPIAGPDAEPVAAIASVLAALVFAASLLSAVPEGTAVIVLAVLALAASVAARLLRPHDAFLIWWTALAALVVVALGFVPEVDAGQAAIATGLSAVALALTRMPVEGRVWLVTPTLAWAGWLAADAAGVSVQTRTAWLAIVTALLCGVATWWKGPAEHVATVAAILAGASVALLPYGWIRFDALCVLVAAIGSVTVAGELRGVGATDLLVRAGRSVGAVSAGRIAPPALLLAGFTAITLMASDLSGLLGDRPAVVGVLLTGLALAEAGTTWPIRGRSPLRHVVGVGSFAIAIAGALMAATERRPSAIAIALAIASVAALAPEARWAPMTWTAWAASFAFVGRVAELAGLSFGDAAVAVAGWAAVLVIGGLALDARWSGRVAGAFVRDRRLLAPVALGAIAFLPALALGMPGSDVRVGAVATGGALVFAAVAIELGLGGITTGTYLLLTLAAAALVPFSVLDRPAVVVPWAAALLLVAWGSHGLSRELAPERRWDLPPFWVAHAIAFFALAEAVQIGDLPPTWIGLGALALAVALVLRAPAWAFAAGGLVTVGAIDVGPGWGALALAGCAAGLGTAVLWVPEEAASVRTGLQVFAGAAATGALFELGRFLDWSTTELATAALLLAALATVAGLVAWSMRPELPWAAQGAAAALTFDVLAAGAAVATWPGRAPLVGVLMVLAAQAAAAGIVLHRAPVLMASPPLLCAAWLVGAGELLEGSVQWSSVPVGLAALAVVTIGRWDRQRRGLPAADPPLVALEYGGMAAIVAPSLVETVTVSPVQGLVALGFGVALATWGAITKVRRRLFVGAGAAVGAVVLMLVGPIAKLVPNVKGPGLWVLLVVIGLALIVIATSIERGRARISAAIQRLDELLSGWE